MSMTMMLRLPVFVTVVFLLYVLGSSLVNGNSTVPVTGLSDWNEGQNASVPTKEFPGIESSINGENASTTTGVSLEPKASNTKVEPAETDSAIMSMAMDSLNARVMEDKVEIESLTNQTQADVTTANTSLTYNVSESSITPLPPTNFTVSGTVDDVNVTTTIKQKPEEPDAVDRNSTSNGGNDEIAGLNQTDISKAEPMEFYLIGEVIRGCKVDMFCVNKCRPELKTPQNLEGEAEGKSESEYESKSDFEVSRRRKRQVSYAQRYDRYKTGIRYPSFSNDKQIMMFQGYDSYSYNLRTKRNAVDEERICFNDSLLGDQCSCDSHCVLYGDCCADVFESCMNFTKTEEIISFISDFRNTFELDYGLDDISNTMEENPEDGSKIIHELLKNFGSCNKYINDGVLVVGQCPTNVTNADAKEKCENQISRLLPPVTAKFSSGQVPFKNVFCAKCHGVDESFLTAWSPEVTCDQNAFDESSKGLTISKLEDLLEAGLCNVTFRIPSGLCLPRNCSHVLELSVEMQRDIKAGIKMGKCTNIDELLCETYNFPSEGYKNPHCRKCLGASDRQKRYAKNQSLECKDTILEEQESNPFDKNDFGGGILIILDLSGKYTTRRDDRNQVYEMCEETEVYDPLTQECKELLCKLGFEPYKGECVAIKEDYFVEKNTQMFDHAWKKVQVTFQFQITRYDPCNGRLAALDMFQLRYFNLTSIVAGNYDDSVYNEKDGLIKCQNNLRDAESKDVTPIKIILTLKSAVNVNAILELRALAVDITKAIYEEGNENAPLVQITNLLNISQAKCPQGRSPRRYRNFTLETYKDVPYVVMNSTDYGVYFTVDSVGYDISLSVGINESINILESITVCEVAGNFSTEDCSTVTYWRNQTFLNGSVLLILDSGRYYEAGKYEIHGELIYVCSELEFETKEIGGGENLAYTICSYLFTSISSLFLITMLVIYCLFPELRTLPGKMTASLAGSMLLTFLFNLVTLEDVYNEFVCPFLAALAHLFTLAHFGWMSAISVDMALTFGCRGLNPVKKMKDDDAFVRYGAVVWGLSAILVTTSVVLDVIHPDFRPTSNEESDDESELDTNFPRYGYPLCAWFSGPLWTKLTFIFIPYAITFLINTIGFVLTLVGIRKTSVSAERVGKKSTDRARCLIYIKLSTAMGFTWLLSVLISSFPENKVLPYISLVLVLLQGLLLFLAFMVNKRVSSLVVNRFRLKKLYSTTTQRSAVIDTNSV